MRTGSLAILALSLNLYLAGFSPLAAEETDRQDGAEDAEIVAVVNDRKITRSEIDIMISPQLYSLEHRAYQLRKNALETLINRIVLEEEAKKRGIVAEDLRLELMAGVRVEESEVEEAYNNNLSRFGPPPVSEIEAKERIRNILESQKRSEAFHKALIDLKKRYKIRVHLRPPDAYRVSVDRSGPSKGPETAPVTVIEFSDFQCLYCKEAAAVLERVFEAYKGSVRIVYKHFPLRTHQHAFKAAEAVMCANEQGKFWEYHGLLFANASDLSPQVMRRLAAEIKLDVEKFNACLDSGKYESAVRKDMEDGKRAGVAGTPTFFINDKYISGFIDFEDLKKLVEEELSESKSTLTGR